jgi:hypothetical protein
MKRLNRHSTFFRKANADKTARGDRVIIAYEANSFLCANDLPAFLSGASVDRPLTPST